MNLRKLVVLSHNIILVSLAVPFDWLHLLLLVLVVLKAQWAKRKIQSKSNPSTLRQEILCESVFPTEIVGVAFYPGEFSNRLRASFWRAPTLNRQNRMWDKSEFRTLDRD